MNRMLKIAAGGTALAWIELYVLGAYAGIGPFGGLFHKRNGKLPGNSEQYDFRFLKEMADSPLKGKKIAVLGSSVSYGAYAMEQAVGEYLAARFGCTLTKETVSATTLADTMPMSYVKRLKKLDPLEHFDLFICQLSTNDAAQKKPLGEICADGEAPDCRTVTGAMEYIIRYVFRTWNCPVVFFTGSKYDNERYAAMVQRLYELKEIYGIGILDLWNDPQFNAISGTQRKLYMHDPVHPTRAGYRDWWGPEMEKQLMEYLKE